MSALAGWAVGDFATVLFSGILFHGNVIGFALLVGLYSAFPVLIVWLFVLWPLYCLVPRNHRLWHPPICVGCGVAAGGLLAIVALPLFAGGYGAFLLTAPLIGGVSCAVGCKFKALERDNLGIIDYLTMSTDAKD